MVNLGYYNCDHMTAACIAKDAGIFKELGLKVNVTGNGKVPEAMAAGQMDVGYIGTEGLMRAYLKGSPIFVAANNHLGGSYYLVASNNIPDAKGLVGKKVALGTDAEKNDSCWVRMANEAGIPADSKSYENFDMADKDEFMAMKAGQLAGYLCCDPWGSMAEYDQSGHIVQPLGKLPNGEWGSCCVYSMNQNFAKEHPELAKKMILAHAKAIEYVYTHPVQSAEIFANNYFVPVEVGLMTIYKKTVGEGRTLTWKVDTKNFMDEINYEMSVKTLDKAPGIDEFIQTKLLDESGAGNFDTFIKEKVDPVFPLGMSYEDWKKKAYEMAGKQPA
ncbi:MAG: NMT1/THI5 like protein [Pelotomaculum sp. PtaB.Bin013]|nr:MAG: NMT1/THI5 like protein [Pelotomaculum sp. PtaB.Bin013]